MVLPIVGVPVPSLQAAFGQQACAEQIVVGHRFGGTVQLSNALQPLVQATEQSRALEEGKRRRMVWRIDAGAVSVAAVNGLLAHHYHVQGKDYSGTRAQSM